MFLLRFFRPSVGGNVWTLPSKLPEDLSVFIDMDEEYTIEKNQVKVKKYWKGQTLEFSFPFHAMEALFQALKKNKLDSIKMKKALVLDFHRYGIYLSWGKGKHLHRGESALEIFTSSEFHEYYMNAYFHAMEVVRDAVKPFLVPVKIVVDSFLLKKENGTLDIYSKHYLSLFWYQSHIDEEWGINRTSDKLDGLKIIPGNSILEIRWYINKEKCEFNDYFFLFPPGTYESGTLHVELEKGELKLSFKF